MKALTMIGTFAFIAAAAASPAQASIDAYGDARMSGRAAQYNGRIMSGNFNPTPRAANSPTTVITLSGNAVEFRPGMDGRLWPTRTTPLR